MDDFDLLTALRPHVDEPGAQSVLRARRRLLRHAVAPRVTALRRHRATRRRLAVLTATAAAATAAVTVAGTIGLFGRPPAASARAAALFHRAAAAAATEPSVHVRPGQFIYVRMQATWASSGAGYTYLQPQLYEAWLRPDSVDAVRIQKTYQTPVFLHPGDRKRLAEQGITVPAAGSVETMSAAGDHAAPGLSNPSYDYLQRLPSDPGSLYAMVSRYAENRGVTHAQEMLDTVTSLLEWSIAPPKLRSALFEVATRIPGVDVFGAVDAAGRHGTAVGLTADGVRYETVFDPDTGELLGQRQVLTRPADGAPAGTVIAFDSETITVVNHVSARAGA